MKIYQSWKRNAPSTIQGESITYTIIYSSQTKGEIDRQEEYLNKVIKNGSINIIDTDGKGGMSMEEYTTTADCRGTWLHPGTKRSSKFICSICKGEVYYPQANNNRKDSYIGVRCRYLYCPYCTKHMQPLYGDEE